MKYAFKKIKTYIAPFLNWRILIIYLPIWFLMSGWTYLFIYLGAKYGVGWMLASGTFWATILWLPFTPEKLITIPITLVIYMRVFGHGNKDTASGQLQRGNKGDAVSSQLQLMVVEARGDWQKTKTHLVAIYRKTKTHLVAIYRKTKTWFRRNYGRLVKTMTLLLIMILLGLILLIGC